MLDFIPMTKAGTHTHESEREAEEVEKDERWGLEGGRLEGDDERDEGDEGEGGNVRKGS